MSLNNPFWSGGSFMSLSHVRPATAAATILALGLAVGLPAQAAATKEQIYQEMLALANQLRALKSRLASDPSAAGAYAAAFDRYGELSRQMGGDDPGRLGAYGVGPGRTSDRRDGNNGVLAVPSSSPPRCTATTTNASNTTPVAIPTGPAVVASTLDVTGAGSYLWDLDLTTNITHTFAADLDITIQSPAGTVVTLTTDNGAGNDNVFNGTLWDDQANPGGQVPYTTNNGLVTDHAYVNLTRENPNGTWTLTISDDLAADGGSLSGWSLGVTTFPAPPTTVTPTTVTNTTPVAIPSGPAVVASALDVTGAGASICRLTLVTNITHTFAADLDITIQSPAGTVVTLTTDNGAGNDNVFDGTLWDDQANPGGQVPYTTNNGLVTDHAYVNLTH
ncbi:MAG: proprotein convertase P-domain-containing protein [Chromatiaceae bacterium]|nr:proprotein convertase P-domain-containing protein [Chromatiaceae bacterium]